jgi:heme/copper-type cytochrome/quinol oxidase subunit 2
LNPLAEPIFWIAAVICLVAELALLRSAFMPHPDTADSPSLPHSGRGLEMIWAIVPAIVLVILLAATWRAVHH